MPGGVKAGQSGSAALPCKDIALAATGWEAGEGTTPPSSEYKSSPKLAGKSSLPMPESLNFPHPKTPLFPKHSPRCKQHANTHGGVGVGGFTWHRARFATAVSSSAPAHQQPFGAAQRL